MPNGHTLYFGLVRRPQVKAYQKVVYLKFYITVAALLVGRSRDRFPVVSVDFSVTLFPSDRTMALRSAQALVKMSTRNIPGVKAAGA